MVYSQIIRTTFRKAETLIESIGKNSLKRKTIIKDSDS